MAERASRGLLLPSLLTLAALLALDPARPVYAEAESRRIGSVQLPDALLERLPEATASKDSA